MYRSLAHKSFLLNLCFGVSISPALSQSIPQHSLGHRPGAERQPSLTASVPTTAPNLDLRKTDASLSASAAFAHYNSNAAVIMVEGSPLLVTKNSVLTPAQLVATMQVLNSGQQTLSINRDGSAKSGVFSFTPNLQNIQSLVIPAGVTAKVVQNLSNINLTGALENFGTLIINPRTPHFAISASRIANYSDAQIYGSAAALNILAKNDFSNAGKIMNSGNLQIVSGTFLNSGVITASKDLTLVSNTGKLLNSGTISSQNASVFINGAAAISFINTNGTVSAQNGNINIGDSRTLIENVYGGNFQSLNLNLITNAQSGKVTLDAKSIAGLVNVTACDAHLDVLGSTLNLGNISLSGDPTFYNTAGDLVLNGSITTNGNDLALVASGNIYAKTAANIDTSSKSAKGGNIVILAGANFTSTGPSQGSNDSNSVLTITGASSTGGYVDFSGELSKSNGGLAISALNSSGSSGGDISVGAYAGTVKNSGSITLANKLNINTQGTDSSALGRNGNIFFVAPNTISIGSISADGAANNGGKITISASDPTIPAGTLELKNGTALNGGSIAGTQTTQNGTILVSGALKSVGDISIESANFSSTGSITLTQRDSNSTGLLAITSSSKNPLITGNLTVANGTSNQAGGEIQVLNTSTGGINVTGTISALGAGSGSGGIIELKAADSPSSIDSSNQGGTISFSAGATIKADGGTNGGGGFITLLGKTLLPTGNTKLSSTGPSFIGGRITLIATNDASNLSIGSSSGTFAIDNRSANGAGQTVIQTPGNITVEPSGFLAGPTVSGAGDSLRLHTANGNILIKGTLALNGKQNGSGGSILITQNSSSQFEIGNPNTKNGVTNILSAEGEGVGAGGSITIVNYGSGGLALNKISQLSIAPGANGDGGLLRLDSSGLLAGTAIGTGGKLSVPAGTYAVDAQGTGTVGGIIILQGKTLSVISGSSIKLSANGSAFGGVILVKSLDQSQNIEIGNAGLISNISTKGSTEAGSVIVESAGNLTLGSTSDIQNPTGPSGTAGFLRLTAGATLTIPGGTYNFDGNGSGARGGTINFEGNSIALTGSSSLTLSANGALAGGSVRVVTYGNQNITVGAAGLITQVTADGQNAGNVYLEAGGNLSLNNQSDISTKNSVSGNGGTLALYAHNTLTIPAGAYHEDGIGSGDGGSILFAGKSIVLSGGSSISASANSTQGSGGQISIIQTGAFNLNVSAAGSITAISVDGAGGSSGKILLSSGADLLVDPAVISTKTTGTGFLNGATLTCAAGAAGLDSKGIQTSAYTYDPLNNVITGTGQIDSKYFTNNGNLRIVGALNANAADTGSGGNIFVYCNSTSIFDVGVHGVNGSSTMSAKAGSNGGSGGSISVINYGTGGVKLDGMSFFSVSPGKDGSGGNITLGSTDNSAGPLLLPSGTLSVDGSATGGTGGSITLAGSAINISGQVTLSADSICCSSGTINLASSGSSSDIVIDTSITNIQINTNQGTVNITSGRNLTIDPAGLLAKEINLQAGFKNNAGNLTIVGTALGNAGHVDLRANGDITIMPQIEAESLTVYASHSGNVNIQNSLTANNGALIIVAEGKIDTTLLNTACLCSTSNITIGAGVTVLGADFNNLQYNGSKSPINLATASPTALTATDAYYYLAQANINSAASFPGNSGGNITIKADGNIVVGYVDSYGGGGSNDSGGEIHIESNTSNITINGEINSSGGPGNVYQPVQSTGLASGAISINSPGDIVFNGPVAAEGGPTSGAVTISGKTLSFNATFDSYFTDALGIQYIDSKSPLFGLTVFAAGQLNVIDTKTGLGGIASNSIFNSDANFASTNRDVTASLSPIPGGIPFTVNTGSFPVSNGSIGNMKSSTNVNINGIDKGTTLSADVPASVGNQITENGVLVAVTDGQKLTPAEWVALIQVSNGKQSIVLNSSGQAVGGTVTIDSANIPVLGFTQLTIPQSLSTTLVPSSLTVAKQGSSTINNDGSIVINGELIHSGSLSLTGSTITGSGNVNLTGSGTTLTLTSTSGNIGSSNQALGFIADNISATTAGVASGIFLNNPAGATVIQTSSTSTTFQLSSFGDITTAAKINALNVTLSALPGSAGSIAINHDIGQSTGTITLTADGNGSITQGVGIVFKSNNLNLASDSGEIGNPITPLNTSTANLSASTSGPVEIVNSLPVGNTILSITQSRGNDFSVSTDSSIAVAGSVSGSNITLKSTNIGGSISLGGQLSADGTVTLSADGKVSDSANSTLNSDKLVLSTNQGPISLGNTESGGGALNVSHLKVTSISGPVQIQNNLALGIDNSTIGNSFTVSSPVSISTEGNITANSLTISTPSLTNSFTISASSGALTLQSPSGTDLSINGKGTLSSSTTLTLFSDTNILMADNQTINGSNISIQAPNGALELLPGVVVSTNASTSFDIKGILFGDPGTQLSNTGKTPTLSAIDPNSTLGTIASPLIINPSGALTLNGNILIGSKGKNLIVISEGDVIVTAAGLKTIDLSNTSGRSGSLIVLAGFQFAGTPTGQLDTTTLFSNFKASTIGGSINLLSTSINTSNTTSSAGGSVLMAANAGSQSAGNISVGSITTSSKLGQGGQVQILAPGGVSVAGSITTSGSAGAGAINLSAAPYTHGNFSVLDGYMSPDANFTANSAQSGSGAAVTVTGSITSSSSNKSGAAVNIKADAQIFIGGTIATGGALSSGAVSLNSLNGAITAGLINTNGNSIADSKSANNAGNGAAVSIFAPSFITLKGINTAGGNTTGTGKGGNAGPISIQTATLAGVFKGNTLISGAVTANGGNAVSSSAGNGSSITIKTGALQVLGKASVNGVSASVINSGGKNKTTSGAAAAINIDTYAVQQIPSNFNLTSSANSEFALVGGLLTVGISPVINGTAGAIVSGLSSVSKGEFATGSGFQSGVVSVSANAGSGNSILIGSTNFTISPGNTNATRIKVTPAEALALYQVSLGNKQTIGLAALVNNVGGQASSVNPQTTASPSVISVDGQDLPASGLKTFILSAVAGSATINDVKLQVTGLNPYLNISKSAPRTINGQIEFINAKSAFIDFGAIATTVAAGASISSAGSLLFAVTNLTNNGTISTQASSSPVLFFAPGKAAVLANNGTISASSISLPANGLPLSFSYTNSSTGSTPLSFSPQYLSSYLSGISQSLMPGTPAAKSTTITLTTAGNSGPAIISGTVASVNSTLLNITAAANAKTKTNTDLQILQGTNLASIKSITMKSAGTLVLGSSSGALASLMSPSISLTSSSDLLISKTNLTAANGMVVLSSSSKFVDDGNSQYSGKQISINSKAVTFGGSSASQLTASTGVTLNATAGQLILDNGSSISTDTGLALLQSSQAIKLYANVSAGSKSVTTSLLVNADVQQAGSIKIVSGSTKSAGGLNIGGNLNISASGTTKSPGNITATVFGGDISFQSSNTKIQSNGGNIILLTNSNISGSGSNSFVARGVALDASKLTTNTGGSVELGAGTNTSQLTAALKISSGTKVSDTFLGANNTILNNSGKNGVVVANAPAASIDLAGSSTSTVDVSKGGAAVFDALNGKSIQLNGTSITTEAYKPIAYVVGESTRFEVVQNSGSTKFASIYAPGTEGAIGVYENGLLDVPPNNDEDGKVKSKGHSSNWSELNLLSGEFFVNAIKPTVINTSLAKVLVKKGALVLCVMNESGLRVTACSGPGEVSISIAKQVVSVAPGEEIFLSSQKPSQSEVKKADGIGRRFTTSHQVGTKHYATRSDISLITLMTNLSYLKSLAHSVDPDEKRIASKMLKTAAVVGQVTNYRGRYDALKSKEHPF